MRIELWQRNLAALWIAQTLMMIAFSFVFPFMPLYLQVLGVTGTDRITQWAGLIGSSAAITLAIAQPIWGNLADRWGRRPMVIRSMISASIIVTIMGFATAPEQILVLRLIQGAFSGTLAASNALVATSTPKHRLGFALGLMQVAMFSGNSVGPLIGGVIADTFGFRTSFWASGSLMMVGTLIVLAFVREDFTPAPATEARPGIWTQSRSLFSIGIFPILVGVIFLIQLGGVIVGPVLALFVSDLNGPENAATISGLVLAGTGAVSAVSAVIIGRYSDRIGRTLILTICLIGACLTYIPQAFVNHVWELLALRTVLGVFLGGLMPTANALIADLVPQERRGSAFGLGASANATANFIGPLSAAGIATHWGLRAVFLATGVLFAVAVGWVNIGFRRFAHRQPQPQPESGAMS